eukprot:3417425-Heterocapsa_arctica.AAC.1
MDELQTAAGSAAAELSPMDQAMVENLQRLMTELQNADKDLLVCAADESTVPDLANLWARQLADFKTANARIKVLSPAVRRVPPASVPTEAAAADVDAASVATEAVDA